MESAESEVEEEKAPEFTVSLQDESISMGLNLVLSCTLSAIPEAKVRIIDIKE